VRFSIEVFPYLAEGAIPRQGCFVYFNGLFVHYQSVRTPLELTFTVARDLLSRTRKRLDREAANALPLYAEGAGLLSAGASVLFPPLAVLVIGGLLALLLGGRRRAGEKYAGLRILR
jgi:hypothetical protein